MNRGKVKSVVFVSDFFNHHLKPFSEEMHKRFGKDFLFIEIRKMSEERVKLGWGMNEYPEYVIPSSILYSKIDSYTRIINDADLVITGANNAFITKERVKQGKLTFRYTERPLKLGIELKKYIPRFFKWRFEHPSSKPIYMLCASAYSPLDYSCFGMFKNKTYKWGYYTALKKYDDIEAFIEEKQENSIIWVARFLNWKHPEVAINLAKLLKDEGYSFKIKMIGIGPYLDDVKEYAKKLGVEDFVEFLGSMKPEQVREHMEKSQIHIFTSDKYEGWGAVLNEAMNSACASVSSHLIGAAPYLVKNGENGLIYEDGNLSDLFEKTKFLLNNSEKRKEISRKAYETIINDWSAENAVNRILDLTERILCGEKYPDIYDDGVCSKAPILKENWIKNEK